MTFIMPEVLEPKFTCPHCNAITQQHWESRRWNLDHSNSTAGEHVHSAYCTHCKGYSIWVDEKMLYPDNGGAPSPNSDLPETVKGIYLEAASISEKSPRGAAALLRLALQELCKNLGEKGKDINADIASLVKKGLPGRVQQALDIVRVTGNNAVHPGQIDVDDPEVVGHLFSLINVIAEYMITMPNRIGTIYNGLPEGALEQIGKRDNGNA